ncbi:subclass B3 metallo-beta-lactamase [Rubrivirga sp. IMCC45206]|uniref:subclass B3 metallo-beta-lactamase n=1 Tax=Rubrivirga sp. IMCC45206 TaxID=3391614 RepID=UPI00398F8EAA
MPAPSHRWRLVRRVLLALAAVGAVVLFGEWRQASRNGGQQPAEPFRIAGDLYYVGANDVAAFLIAGPDGHVLIDGGYPGTPPLIAASIEQLGFDVSDVAVLLNSEPHYDHAGGLAELQARSGAELWASHASADVLEAGGADPDVALPIRVLMWTGLIRYPPPRVDRRITDGDTLRVGPIALVAHVTGGHTRGCTSWEIPLRDGDRALTAVSACSLARMGGTAYPEQAADFERSFRVLRGLSADVWVTSHARLFGRYRKFQASAQAGGSPAPFIDPEGYRAYVDSAEARYRRGVVH